ncbi:type VI secretion system contractile sheath large subunit [Sulfidibacter corallicola]|uniref:Type VI secretion system contractile sheath large subunit n=1 Tax=Sulfidibacter corallicola TaxID=2818388 RepID=A0A8A4U3Q5_SULCO|nr:type VI secretion system contractile sheath large subunit [Sulfidibacter corallicola]QTD53375.1 type VI secretion system contractile sheath large subunit [Sulfidibacter corallicola]
MTITGSTTEPNKDPFSSDKRLDPDALGAEPDAGADGTAEAAVVSEDGDPVPDEAADEAAVEQEEAEAPQPEGPEFGSPEWQRYWRIALDQAIVRINEMLAHQLAEIMAHRRFRQLESLWIGANQVVDVTMGRADVEVELLCISKEDLMEDFDEYPDPSDSGLFYHLYKTEYDQAGGKPFTAILTHYEFSHKAFDLRLMKMLSMVAASCHCPTIGNAGATLFGLRNIRNLEEIKDFELHFGSQEYVKWQSLRENEDSRYLGMALPRMLIQKKRRRLPPLYCRHYALRDSMKTWIPASYGFGMILIRSFIRHGWCIYIRGPRTGGLIGEIVPSEIGGKGMPIREIPLEVSLSDHNEHEISNQGFIPFVYYKDWERICLFSAPSLQRPDRRDGGQATFDRIAASMAYLFLVCRLAHFTKVIQRENIGTTKEAPELEKEINRWLKGLITKMPNPEVELRSLYPLRDGLVKVSEDPSNPGFYRAKLVVQPHLQLEGVNAELTLISKMPREKEQ